MSGSPLLALSSRALQANYAALQTIGHNIANANVAGYSRQTAELATSFSQFNGSGYFGKGVEVATVTRAYNGVLTTEARAARSLAGMDSVHRTQLDRLETLFKPGAAGLGQAVTDFFSSIGDLAAMPSDPSVRAVVLQRAGDLASRFAGAGDAIDELQYSLNTELSTRVAEVNTLAQSIARANQGIAAAKGNQPPNDLLDERDRLIGRLSDLMSVTTVPGADGTLSVFVSGGQRLVLGGEAASLQMLQDPTDASRQQIGIVQRGVVRPLDGAALGGGEIAGLLRFQNDELVLGRNLLGRLANAIAGAVNEQQERGLNLLPPAGSVASTALFGVGAPQALANAENAVDANGAPIGSLTLTITDHTALEASDYAWAEDPTSSTGFRLTRLADGTTFEVSDGSVIDGFTINFGAPGPQPGDQYLLQPVGRGASGMSRLFNDPRALAAAAPQVGTTAATNTGSVGVASLTTTAAPLPLPGGTTRFTFTSDTGDYNWELLDSGGNLVSSGSGTWVAGQPLPNPDINGFSLRLSGVPRTGDIVSVVPTAPGAIAGDSGNASALLALRDAGLVAGRNLTDGYAEAMTSVGVRVQTARSAAEVSGAVAKAAEMARSSDAGVNLDEEAAKMIQFQQSYQAAAKMLQVAQQVFEALLQVSGR
jgi:flagellar hook-associated protein 1